MDLNLDIRPVSDLAQQAPELLVQVNEMRRPVYLTENGRARGVLVDPGSFEETRRAIGLMKLLAQGERDFEQGRHSSQEEVFGRLEARLHAAQKSALDNTMRFT